MRHLLQDLQEATQLTLDLLHESVASLTESTEAHTDAIEELKAETKKKLDGQ